MLVQLKSQSDVAAPPTGNGHQPLTLGTVQDVVRGRLLAKKMPPMSYMELILTDQCNMRCSYCFEADKNPHIMSEELALQSVDFLMETSRDIKDLTVLFFGGEPLLRFEMIKKVVEYTNARAAELGKRVHYDMTTNGTLVEEEHLEFFRDNGVKFLLSMDGGREDHNAHRRFAGGQGSYDTIRKKIQMFKRYQPWLGAKMTIMPDRGLNLRKNIEELWEAGVNQFIIGYGHGVPWTVQDLLNYEQGLMESCELYLEMKYNRRPFRMSLFEEGEPGEAGEKHSFGCGAGRGRFCVDSYGDIYGCSKLATITGMHNGVLPFGNVQQGFTRIENRMQFLVSEVGPREKCSACEFREVCGGGCPAVNYARTQSIYDPDDLSCRIVFVTQRVHAYMQRRHREVFGDRYVEEAIA